jgi:RNA polymerase sigma-70 factor (ECF subfamily)
MPQPESTCWTVIEAAAAGSADDRAAFVRRYGPVARAYLAARWRSSPCLQELEDAVQEVFLACFARNGVLDQAERGRGFRPFFYGVVRNVARRIEQERARRREQQPPGDVALEELPDNDESLSQAFDRAWARALVREAAQRMAERAQEAGEAASRRVELLRLRFQEELPIRDIAARWGADAAALHHEYARARQEFRTALEEVVAFHHPGGPDEVELECANLLALLG